MKILIAVPCMDEVAAGFAQSLATLDKVGDCVVTFIVGSLIYESRNKICKQAIEIGADYVMWFDSDMVIPHDTMSRLLADEKDIVSGLYFRRVSPYTPVAFKKIRLSDGEEQGHWEGFDDYPENTVFELEGIGFGCVLITTDVLMDIASKYGTWFDPIGHYGEDLSFCIRARECGYKVWLDSSVKLGHVAKTVIGEEFYKAVKGVKSK